MTFQPRAERHRHEGKRPVRVVLPASGMVEGVACRACGVEKIAVIPAHVLCLACGSNDPLQDPTPPPGAHP